ncbi:hypothetical protein H4R26_005474, partial [Coemansia thaxteri]
MCEGVPADIKYLLVKSKLVAPACDEVKGPEESTVDALLDAVVKRYPALYHLERTLASLRTGTTFVSASRDTVVRLDREILDEVGDHPGGPHAVAAAMERVPQYRTAEAEMNAQP